MNRNTAVRLRVRLQHQNRRVSHTVLSLCEVTNSRANARTSARAGFGLTHTVLLMVVLGLLMGLAATVLGQSYVTYRQTLNHFQSFQTLQLAQSQFRSDAHEATSVDLEDQLLVLVASNSKRIEYESEEGKLVRRVFQGEEQLGEQAWQFPAPASATWNVDRSGRVDLAQVRFEFQGAFDFVETNADGSESNEPARNPKLGLLKIEPTEWCARVGIYRDAAQPKDDPDTNDDPVTNSNPEGKAS
ncbi:MAG: hypothetical protein AAGG44_09780 [Planctomycetota bacterium]